jgi:hypothetical protein
MTSHLATELRAIAADMLAIGEFVAAAQAHTDAIKIEALMRAVPRVSSSGDRSELTQTQAAR